MGILHRLRIALAWRTDHTDNHWRYIENAVSGERRAELRSYTPGIIPGPPDPDWLRGWPAGEWRRRNPPPARPTR